MKKLYPLCLLSCLPFAQSAWAESPEVRLYGRIIPKATVSHTQSTDKLTGERTSSSNTDRPQLRDNGSYVGVRAGQNIGEDWRISFRTDWRTPFESERRSMELRDAWIAVRHKDYGTIKAGRIKTPDAMVASSPPPNWFDGERANNSIRYESPVIKDTRFMVQYAMDENNPTTLFGTDGVSVYADHVKERYGVSAAYTRFNAKAASFDTCRDPRYLQAPPEACPLEQRERVTPPTFKDSLRVSGHYAIKPNLRAGATYQHNRFNNLGADEKGFSVQLEHFNKTGVRKQVFYRYSDNRFYEQRRRAFIAYAPKDRYSKEHAIGMEMNKQFNPSFGIGLQTEFIKRDDPVSKHNIVLLSTSATYRF